MTGDRNDVPMPDGDEDPVMATAVSGLETFRRYTYWSMVSAVVVLLLLPAITGPVPYPPDPGGTVALLAVLTVIATLVPLIADEVTPMPAPQPRSERARLGLLGVGGVASVIVAASWLHAGDTVLWAFAPAMVVSVGLARLRPGRRQIAITGTVLAALVVGLTVGGLQDDHSPGGLATSGTLTTVFALFLTLATLWTWRVAVQLDEARRRAAALAVANERLRFAADLHDIQGHHLQVIALKSELAGRLLAADPEAARHEIDEVQRLAADARRDTRAVVQGYRRTSLDAEIANATSVLASAGIDAQLHVDPDVHVEGLTEDARHLLGLVVREAITNVLRHSTATRADIGLRRDDDTLLTVTNDGVHTDPTTADGGGLHDLAERLQAGGATLIWRRDGDRFEVHATLPTAVAGAPAQRGSGS